MGRAVKVILVVDLIAILVIYSVMAVTMQSGFDSRITKLESDISFSQVRKEQLAKDRADLQMVRENLAMELAMAKDETDRMQAAELLKQLKDAEFTQARDSAAAKLAAAQQLAAEKAAAQQKALEAQRLAAQQQAIAAAQAAAARRTTSAS